jgi:hypothetical protein
MNMKTTSILILITIQALACNQSSQRQTRQDAPEVPPLQQHNLPANNTDEPKPSQEPSALLQGTWQHKEDSSNYVVFQGNLRKETASGMAGWDEEEFTLSDVCLNESDKNKATKKEDGRYISCVKSDLCWYILSVDEHSLTLSYMARGNNLAYRRVK